VLAALQGTRHCWLLLVLTAFASGCALERSGPRFGPEPEYLGTIEDTAAPSGGISLKPAVSNPITCPHCGEVNRLGQTDCTRCGKRLSTRPLMEPCKLCGGTGKLEGEKCAICGGSGWHEHQAPEEAR
jgi:hypothetical protein